MCPEDFCWETGIYLDICQCELCDYKYECSASEQNENE